MWANPWNSLIHFKHNVVFAKRVWGIGRGLRCFLFALKACDETVILKNIANTFAVSVTEPNALAGVFGHVG